MQTRHAGMSPEQEAAEAEVVVQLRRAVRNLPTNLRLAMELRSERDLSVREIATTLAISGAPAKS